MHPSLYNKLFYHSLEIDLRIPITVIQDYNVCSCKIDTQTSCSGTQHKNEFAAVWHVESIDLCLSLFMRCLSVQTAVVKSLPETVIFKDI